MQIYEFKNTCLIMVVSEYNLIYHQCKNMFSNSSDVSIKISTDILHLSDRIQIELIL
jgi:hypothetical protein